MAEINYVNKYPWHVPGCGNQIRNCTHTNTHTQTHIYICLYENITCLVVKKQSLRT